MSPATQVLLSSMLTFGVPLGFAIREILVNRTERPTRRPDPPAPMPDPPRPVDPGFGEKPLPACLLPPFPPITDEGPVGRRVRPREKDLV